MKHLRSLESTQEARVALGNSWVSFSIFRALQNFPRTSYRDNRTLTHEPMVNLHDKNSGPYISSP